MGDRPEQADKPAPRLIGLVGKAQAGKDTVANYLVQRYGFTRRMTAERLKAMLLQALQDCPPPGEVIGAALGGNDVHNWEVLLYRDKPPFIRWLLQFVGTNILRQQVAEDFHAQALARTVDQEVQAGGRVVVQDIRFPNEAEVIRRADGELWRVVRTDLNLEGVMYAHPSETALDTLVVDRTLSAPTGVERLYRLVDAIMDGAGAG